MAKPSERDSKSKKHVTPLGRRFLKTPPLGGSVAEHETDIANYYVDAERYLEPLYELPSLSIFVGPRGVGKSAIQRVIEERRQNFEAKIISIRPDDVALWTIVGSAQLADEIYKGLDPRWLNKQLWNYLFVLEVLRNEYGDTVSLLTKIKSVFSADMSRIQRLIDKGIRGNSDVSLSSRFMDVIEELKLSFKAGPVEAGAEIKTRRPSGEHPQANSGNILNDLGTVTTKLKNLLDRNYLVLLDDLDLNWTGHPRHVELLEALLASLLALSRSNSKVHFVVALREDIYRTLNPEDPDKLRNCIHAMSWAQKSIKAMVRERIRWATGAQASTEEGFPEIFDETVAAKDLHLLWEVCGESPRRTLAVLDALIKGARDDDEPRVNKQQLLRVVEKLSVEFLNDLQKLYEFSFPGLAFVAQSARKVAKQFDMGDAEIFCADLLERIENGGKGAEAAKWINGYVQKPDEMMRKLLEVEFLLYKPSRDSAPRTFAETDPIDNRTWFAVNPIYALGLGLG